MAACRGAGTSWAFLTSRWHRAVEPLHDPWNLGYDDADEEHCLILDRAGGRAGVPPLTVAQAFLRSQHPPPPELTLEQREATERGLRGIMTQHWQKTRSDPKDIERRMTEEWQVMARMVSWIDQYPPPPSARPGHRR